MMSKDKDIISLPYVDIQHDALSVFDDVEQGTIIAEDIWISGYRAGSPSVHGKAKVVAAEGGGSELRPKDGVHITRLSKTNFEVSVPALHIQRLPIRFPKAVIHPPYKKTSSLTAPLQINSISLSPKSPQLLIGGPDGYCGIIPISPETNPDEILLFKGHVGDVLDVQWFPSGEVCLTASSDLSIRIWGAKDGINPRTLLGHSRAVTSLAVIGVGKEVLSGSKDGTIRLWEVGSSKQLKRWNTERVRPVEGLILVGDDQGRKALDAPNEERLVLVLTQAGLEIWDWSAPGSPTGKARTSLEWGIGTNLVCGAYCPELGLLVTGHTNGIVTLRRLSDLAAVIQIRRNESPVYSLRFSGSNLYMGTAAGLPCRLEVRLEGEKIEVQVAEELAGWEAVGVETWSVGKEGAFSAGGEGGIRRY